MKTKILLTILYLATLATYVMAQSPGFNYQAVLRDAQGAVMPNANVTLFISLTEGESGPVLYRENHVLATDELGILQTMVGTGNVESGDFSAIVGVQNLSIKLEADIPGEPDVVDVGFSKIGATPFALYGRDEDSDPDNEMQSLSLEGDSLKISGTPGVSLNGVNYWEKTDTGFVLQMEDFARNSDENIYTMVANDGLSINARDDESRTKIHSTVTQVRDGKSGLTMTSQIGSGPANEPFPSATLSLSSRLSAKGLGKAQPSFAELFSIILTGRHPLEHMEREDFTLQAHTRQFTNVEQNVDPIDINTDFTTFNKNLKKAEMKVMTKEEYNKKNFGSVVVSRRGIEDMKLRSNEGFDFTSGVVFSEKYFNEQFGAGSVVSPRGDSWGGTMSTANAAGLTTLSGALPGIEPTTGYNIVFNGQNFGVVSTINSESAGSSSSYGANGQLNTTAGTFAGDADGGAFITFDQSGNRGAYLWTNNSGASQVGADQFVMTASPPGRSTKLANYTAPMGGEVAAYDRGTAHLVNGEATVTCPAHFQWVADESSMTVTITPLSAESNGIAVIEKSNGGFKVKEMHGGKGNYSFDYLVMCKRKGYEEFRVVREKPQLIADDNQEILRHIPKGPIRSIKDLYK